MTGKKKSLAEKLADEARQQYEASKKKAAAKSNAEALMADVEAKLKARQSQAEQAAASASASASKAKANAESLMDDLTAKLKAKQPKAAPKPAPEIYEVQPGDSLSKIAKEKYGDMARWQEIFEANKDQIKDPSLIQVGQKLVIPR